MSKARGLADLGSVTTRLDEVGNTDGALSNRNLIINGAMGIDQRNAGVAVTAVNDTYTTDRWVSRVGGTGAYTAQQTAVTTPSGFTNAMEVVVTTADASLAAGDYYGIEHRIEGLNFARCAFGAANATDVTLSFWVKSSISGTFSGSIRNGGNNRSYVFEYTITSPTTDQLVTVTIPGDVTGTWLVTSGIGLSIWFDLGSGSTFQGTVDTWQGGLIVTTAGAVKLISTVSATWQITGVQLEVGDTATPFEHRSYGQELALCQRYYQKMQGYGAYARFASGFSYSSSVLNSIVNLPVPLRSEPTFSYSGPFGVYHGAGTVSGTSFLSLDGTGQTPHSVNLNAITGDLTVGGAGLVLANNNVNSYLAFDSEL